LLQLVPELSMVGAFCFHRTLVKLMEAISVSGTSVSCAPSVDTKLICDPQHDLHAILSASTTHFLALDTEGKICELSTPLATLLRFKKEEICGSEFLDLVANDVYDNVHDIIDKTLTVRHWQSTAIQLYTKDSHVKDAMLHAIPCPLNDRLFIVVQPTWLEDCYSNGLSTEVNMPAFDLDASHKITMWSIHMTEFSGFTADLVMGLSFSDLLEQDTLPSVQRMLSHNREEAGPSTCTIRFYTLAGIPKMVQLSAVALWDTAGQPIGISIVMKPMVEDGEGFTLPWLAEVSANDSEDDMMSFTSDQLV